MNCKLARNFEFLLKRVFVSFVLFLFFFSIVLLAFSNEENKVVFRDAIIDIGVPPGGNKTPSLWISPENPTSLLYDCRRSFRESEDRSIRKHKSPVRFSAIYRRPLERSLSLYGLLEFFPSTYFIFLRWTSYDFFSIPLKDRSTMSDWQSIRSTL